MITALAFTVTYLDVLDAFFSLHFFELWVIAIVSETVTCDMRPFGLWVMSLECQFLK